MQVSAGIELLKLLLSTLGAVAKLAIPNWERHFITVELCMA
jgi:hypothetical protein